MIYLISDGELTKIGRSKNPIKRLKELQTGHPKRLRLIACFSLKSPREDRKMENRLHYILRIKRCRYNGEWFSLTPDKDLIDLVKTRLSRSN